VRPPDDKSVTRWCEQLRESGSVEKNTFYTGRPKRCDEDVDRVKEAFILSPKKSISLASAELLTPITAVHRILYV
jgi:transposase